MAELLKTFDLAPEDLKMILIWAACFIVLWQFLARVLFGPYLKLVEAREAVTTGAESTAKRQLAQADELMAQFEDSMTQVRVNAMKEKAAIMNRARAQAQEIADKADRTAQEKIKSNRDELQTKLAALRSELQRESDAMVAMVTEKVKSGARTAA